jgi:triosephosphate isomerase
MSPPALARRPLVAANWKMQLTPTAAARYVTELLPRLVDVDDRVEIALAPAAPALDRVGAALRGSIVKLAAQNVSPEPRGAFTGEVSVEMLADLGCAYALVGHSERRALFGETSALVSRKAAALLGSGIRPIVCVGETLAEREAGRTEDVVGEQLDTSLAGIPADAAPDLVVAYEPVWAIGTGKTATPELAQQAHAFIRRRLQARFGPPAAGIRIQYGGSVKPENAAALLAEADVDGALVGGASLYPESFASIVRHALHAAAARERLENTE